MATDLDGLLNSMNEFVAQAGRTSASLIQFMREESLTLEDAINEWQHICRSCNNPQLESMFAQVIERHHSSVWKKAESQFNAKELCILAGWMKLETQAWLAIVKDEISSRC